MGTKEKEENKEGDLEKKRKKLGFLVWLSFGLSLFGFFLIVADDFISQQIVYLLIFLFFPSEFLAFILSLVAGILFVKEKSIKTRIYQKILLTLSFLFSGFIVVSSILITIYPPTPPKSNNPRIMSAMSQVRVIATLIYGEEADYSSLCLNGGLNVNHKAYSKELNALNEDISDQQKKQQGLHCFANKENYCAEARLSNGWFCVDSNDNANSVDGSKCVSADSKCR